MTDARKDSQGLDKAAHGVWEMDGLGEIHSRYARFSACCWGLGDGRMESDTAPFFRDS